MKNITSLSGNSIPLNFNPLPAVDAEITGDPKVDLPTKPPIVPETAPSHLPAVVAQIDQTPRPVEPVAPPISSPVATSVVVAAVSRAEALAMNLTPPQRAAIELLTSGHTLIESAAVAGVSRMTLYRWLKGDAAFLAAFNAWQNDVLDTVRGRLLALSDLAVSTITKALTAGDAKTAMRILEKLGALQQAKPGSTDPAEIKRLQNMEQRKLRLAARKQEHEMSMGEALTP